MHFKGVKLDYAYYCAHKLFIDLKLFSYTYISNEIRILTQKCAMYLIPPIPSAYISYFLYYFTFSYSLVLDLDFFCSLLIIHGHKTAQRLKCSMFSL